MNIYLKYLKRVGGTLLIAFGLNTMMYPLLSGLLLHSENINPTVLRIFDITLLVVFAIAGWNIMKKEAQIRAKKLGKNDPSQRVEREPR